MLFDDLHCTPAKEKFLPIFVHLLVRERDFGHLCDVVLGGLGLGSEHSESDSESLSLLLLVSLGGSGWSDFEFLGNDRVPQL